jgi:acyl-CoA synthetase (AMP-forming)/AMP-acid ligase II
VCLRPLCLHLPAPFTLSFPLSAYLLPPLSHLPSPSLPVSRSSPAPAPTLSPLAPPPFRLYLTLTPLPQVCIRGPSVISGYFKRPDLNEDPTIFAGDGWMRTGDVGRWNDDGTLTLIDRCVATSTLFASFVSFLLRKAR